MIEAPTPARETQRLNALHELRILDTAPEERFDRLTRLARRLFRVPIALVSLVDRERQWFKSASGLDASETPRDISFCGHAILGDDVFLIRDARKDPRFFDNPLVTGDPRVRFYAGCPLRISNGSKVGTLCLIDHDPRDLDDDDLGSLRDLASMAEQELAALQLATMDDLTLLSNRRGFINLGKQAVAMCQRLERPISLLYFDLDDFKAVNDTYGHAEGDYALKSFAKILRNNLRESDVLGRMGGDEFAVILTDSSEHKAREVLERLETAVSVHNGLHKRGYRIAFSAGHVELERARHRSIEDLLAEADARMYTQKRAARDSLAGITLSRSRRASPVTGEFIK